MWSRNSRSGSARASGGRFEPRQRAFPVRGLRRLAPRALGLGERSPRAGPRPDGLVGEDDEALDDVAELAHVPGPRVGPQHGDGLVGDHLGLDAVLAARLLDEGRQGRHVVGAIAQRRRAQRHDGEAEVEVLAERPRGDGALQVAVRRGDDAHVDLERLLAAHPRELARLQDAQHLGLRRGDHVADLVEEDCAAVSDLEEPTLARRRAREGAPLVPEELRLDELGRDRGAVDLDVRLVREGARAVDGARDELLARARLTRDEGRACAWGRLS